MLRPAFPNRFRDAPLSSSNINRKTDFSGRQVLVFFAALTFLTSSPIWTHRLPPISDYVNHLARMHVLETISQNSQLARFYEVHWQAIPNLTMDLLVPIFARAFNIYIAGQIFLVFMLVVIVSGVIILHRALFGRWSVTPLLVLPFLYNYVFLVGLMNYIFGLGVALWGLAGWVFLRDRKLPIRLAVSIVCVLMLFFCHLSALGIYGIGILSIESLRLWQYRKSLGLTKLVDFVVSGVPFFVAVPLLLASPTIELASTTYWDHAGKVAGVMFVFTDYWDIVTLGLISILVCGTVWAFRHSALKFHPLAAALLCVGGLVYLALPRVMFDTYMADQRVPLGIAFMLFGCVDLAFLNQSMRTGFVGVLIIMISIRLIEIDVNWSTLSESTSQLRSSVRRIEPNSKVFVAYANASAGEDVNDLGLVHAACVAVIDRSSLVTTLFTVVGKQVLHVRPQYQDYADTRDGTPPSVAQMLLAASMPLSGMPAYWINWPKFDYVYILFTEDDAPNPDPSRLRLLEEGDRFQLYRVIDAQKRASTD
jgi:hypothetical protein